MREQRRLAAILVADVVGYSKLVGRDEAGTLAQLRALQTEVIEPAIGKHAGRLFKAVGDGFLVGANGGQSARAGRARQRDHRPTAARKLLEKPNVLTRLRDNPVAVPVIFRRQAADGRFRRQVEDPRSMDAGVIANPAEHIAAV